MVFMLRSQELALSKFGLMPTEGVANNQVCVDGVESCFSQMSEMAARRGMAYTQSGQGTLFVS